jgi:hypothetical protein
MRFICIEILTSFIDFDDLELPLNPVPVEDTLDTRPATPFETSPTGLGGTDARLGKACDVDIGTVYAGVADTIRVCVLYGIRGRRRGRRMVGRGGRATSPYGIGRRGKAGPRATCAALSVAVGRNSFGIRISLLRGAGGMGMRIGMSHATSTAASGSTTRRSNVPAVLEDAGGVGLLKGTVVFRVLV